MIISILPSFSFSTIFLCSAALLNLLSIGAAYEEDWFRNDEGGVTTAEDKRWNFVTETGVKFRFRITGKLRLFTLGYQFAGVRLGIRFSGFDALKNGRLIAEIGAGVF